MKPVSPDRLAAWWVVDLKPQKRRKKYYAIVMVCVVTCTNWNLTVSRGPVGRNVWFAMVGMAMADAGVWLRLHLLI